MDIQKAIKYYDRKFEKAKEVRQTYESTWDDIMTYIAPDLQGYLTIEDKDKGYRNDDVIYDDTPTKAWLDCSAGMFANIASPSRPWMQRTMSEDEYNDVPGVRSWLDAATSRDYSTLHQSNFYKCNFSMFAHGSAIGTAVIIGEPHYDKLINWIVPNVGEYYLAINGRGEVDTLFRDLTYSAEQLRMLFGESQVPEDVLRTITESNPAGGDYNVMHVIEPDSQGVVPFKKPWANVYYLKDKKCEKQILDAKGFFIQPFAAWRWYANNNETYGKFNPGRVGLGNCMQLSQMIYDYMDACAKELMPPTQGPPVPGGLDMRPGQHNIIDPTAIADPTIKRLFETNPQLQYMWAAIQDKRDQIKQDFYLDLFMPISMNQDKTMTATEVTQRANERMLALGPVLENVNTEYLNPVTEIVFNASMTAKAYPPIEEYVSDQDLQEIEGQDIKTNYVSILAQAQKATDLGRMSTVLEFAERMGQYDPRALRKINTTETIDEVAKMSGAPGRMIRSDEEVEELDKQAAEQQQAEQATMQAEQLSNVAGQASKMPMDTDNALTRMLGVTG